MTIDQKEKIQHMRTTGHSYKQISTVLNISINTIKSYCRRYNLTLYNNINTITKLPKINKVLNIICKNCGKLFLHGTRGKPKKFCSETCRRAWWKSNESHSNKQAWYTLTCAGCGNVFKSYGNKNRKFCSYSCYIKMRYT